MFRVQSETIELENSFLDMLYLVIKSQDITNQILILLQ